MRNFKIKRRTKPIFVSKAAFVNATLLAGVVIFIAVAALTGKIVSDKFISNPVKTDDGEVVITKPTHTPTDNNTPGIVPTPDENPVKGTLIEISAKDYYFVQFGVFANEENARACAESITSRGGAGYIKNIEGNYNVYAMCYQDGNDAKTVVTNLKSDGYSALLKCFSQKGLSINVSGSDDAIKNIEEAFRGMVSVNKDLEGIIYKFDKKEIDRTAAKNELRALLGKIEKYKNTFSQYSGKNKLFEDANNVCNNVYTDISNVLKTEDDTKLSSEMKFVYINNVFNVIQYLDNVVVG